MWGRVLLQTLKISSTLGHQPSKEGVQLPASATQLQTLPWQGKIHVHLARHILELPPCHTPGLPDRIKHSTVAGLEIWCPTSQSRCLVSALVEILHLGGGKAPSLHLPHCIDPELQSRSETSTVDIPCMAKPCRYPLRHSAAGFPSLGILPGSPSCPAETTPPLQW